MQPTDHYVVISADTHAGGSHAQYRAYLDSAYLDDFDAWRNKYKNPFRDLRDTSGRVRNWDSERRRGDEEHDGVVGEVIFPNTVPPFFPSFVLFAAAPPPDEYEHRLAGIRAHNRWLVDFCAEYPERRAGVGQIFLNDIDDAIDDAKWIKEHNLRGGLLLPNVPPDVYWVKHLYDPYFDPLWEVCQDLGIVVNCHGGTGNPEYGSLPVSQLLYITETGFYSQRPFVHTILGGVFERFPKLRFSLTEMGCAWIPQLCAQLDQTIDNIRKTKSIGELRYTDEHVMSKNATEYVRQNFWVGASQPRPADAAAREVLGPSRFMWGSDYPHDEGTHPFTREHLRQVFCDTPPDELQQILGANAAALYDFDLDALQPEADRVGPTVAEIAEPLTELPDGANQALLRASGVTFPVHLERVLPARPTELFRMHTDPEQLARWWGPKGFTAPSVEIDLRRGGGFRIEMQPPDGSSFYLAGEFREVDAPRRLVYTFRYEDPDPDDRETVVTFALHDLGEATQVTVEQGPFATEARRALHRQGWTETLDRLHELITSDQDRR